MQNVIQAALEKFKQFSSKKKTATQPTKPVQNSSSVSSYQKSYNPQIRQLIQNTKDQTSYTPKALKAMNQSGYYADVPNTNTGGGAQFGSVYINPQTLNNPDTNGVATMRHENLHNMDSNMWGQSSAKEDLGNSVGFNYQLGDTYPRINGQITKMMGNSKLYDLGNYQSNDMEKFAYSGMNPNVMLVAQALANRYSQIYQPMSKNINYSPVYPAQEMMYAYQPNTMGGMSSAGYDMNNPFASIVEQWK